MNNAIFRSNQLIFLGLIIPVTFLANFCLAQSAKDRVTIYLPDSVPLVFKYIPEGEFIMGSPEQEQGRDRDESPQQNHRIEEGFYLGMYEITQAQWLSVMHYNPAVFQQLPVHLNQPVENVSWQDCQFFLEKLNGLGIGVFRLPTEIEWEYACRAGTQTRFYWGDMQDWTVHRHAWANSRSMAMPHPVGEKPPNPWGLYDMSGNVWEWTATTFCPYGRPSATIDSLRIFRGGSWFDFAQSQRCANRHKHATSRGYTSIGLRIVMEAYE